MDSIPSSFKKHSVHCMKVERCTGPGFGFTEPSSPQSPSSNHRWFALSDDSHAAVRSPYSEKAEKDVQTSEKVLSESSSNNEPSPYRKRRRQILQMDTHENFCSQPYSRPTTQTEQTVDDRLWPIQMQNAFLETLLVWKARNGRWCGGRFASKAWTEIKDDFNSQTRRNYTTKQLQDKFNRMRTFWREMYWAVYSSGLTGVGWDSSNQTIRARPEQWDTMITLRPSVKRIHKKGFPNFELMTDVFHDSGAQGTMSRSSNLDPLTDEQERDILKRHEGSSKRAAPIDDDDEVDFMDINQQFDSPEAVTEIGRLKRMKPSEKDVKSAHAASTVAEEHAWQAFELQCIQKAKKYEAQTQLIEGRSAANSQDKYNLAACLRLLENDYPNISASNYLKASRLFQDPRYCMRWIEMKPEFRKYVVESDFSE